MKKTIVLLGAALMLMVGCNDGKSAGSGSLNVSLQAESVITDGIKAGSDPEAIKDGWQVDYDKFVATIGDIDIHFSSNDSIREEEPDVFVVDLKKVPQNGLPLWSFEDISVGSWQFYYATPDADESVKKHDSVEVADFERMKTEGWTYLISGKISNDSGQSCPPDVCKDDKGKPTYCYDTSKFTAVGSKGKGADAVGCFDNKEITFEFGADAHTTFGPCEIDNISGFVVSEGKTATVAATLHGDHIFFNGFPEGDETVVNRFVQWFADCDLNLDGKITADELKMIKESDLVEFDNRFDTGGAPIKPRANMYVYLQAQLKTQGHFEGEGECQIDGVAHEHD